MSTVYEGVVFMQGDDAQEILAILDEVGEEAVIVNLLEWHSCGEHAVTGKPAAGSSDSIYLSGEFILTYNIRMGYIGLEHVHREERGSDIP